jgi:hypothetical protein
MNQTSATCPRRLVNHDATATWNKWKGSSVYWPKLSMSALGSRAMQPTQASQRGPATNRDRGKKIGIRKRKIAKQ